MMGFIYSIFTGNIFPEIMRSCATWNIDEALSSNTTMYWYDGNTSDLIELQINRGALHCYSYPEADVKLIDKTKENLEIIYDKIIKIPKILGNRFLYDIRKQDVVTYEMFKPNEILKPQFIRQAFILDKNDWFLPVIETKSVFVYTPNQYTKNLDMCLLSFCNDMVNIKYPNKETSTGVVFTAFVSGLLAGLNKDDLQEEVKRSDIAAKFIYTTKNILILTINNQVLSQSKTIKVREIIFDKKKEEPTTSIIKHSQLSYVDASQLIKEGFDVFRRKIENPEQKIIVVQDKNLGFTSAHIYKGILYIIPGKECHHAYYEELFQSKNIILLLN